MQFDLTNLNPGTWFEMEGGGRVCLRICDGDALRSIRKQTLKKTTEFKKIDNLMQRFTVESVDEQRQEEMIWDYCIVAWEGLFDTESRPLVCDKATKLKLVNGSVFFAKFVGECLDNLRKQLEVESVDAEKNS